MGGNRKSSNNTEVRKETSPGIPTGFPVDIKSLIATIESLNEIIKSLRATVAAQSKIIESNNSADLPAEIKSFVASLHTTIEALTKVNESNNRTIQELTKQNAEQSKKIDELIAVVASMNEQLQKNRSANSNNSSNSNIPPSASNPSKSTGNFTPKKEKKDISLRKKTQEKPGRLPGHEGSGMKLKEVSDRIVDLFPEGCAGCKNLGFCMGSGKVCDKRFSMDVEARVLQTEYKSWEFQCPNKANQIVQGLFPQYVTGSKQYGPNIKNYVVQLKNIGFVSYKRMSKLCSTLGIDLNTGTLLDICNKFADKCMQVKPLLTSLLLSSPVLGVDEEGKALPSSSKVKSIKCKVA
jgi:uncharacterized coiled-coil protein SlyX